MQDEPEARKLKTVSRRYANDAIQVRWEPEYCIHAGMCWRNLPYVFRPRSSPWVVLEGAAADEVARIISLCPSGALGFTRLDGGAEESTPETTIVDTEPDGPLLVRGKLRIEDGMGNLIRETTRASLCRCGHSQNKPFCDLSHERVGFRSGR